MVFGREGRVTRSAAEDLLGTLDSSDMANIVGAIGHCSDAAACFTRWPTSWRAGADLAQFARDLAEHIRALGTYCSLLATMLLWKSLDLERAHA